MTYNVFVGTLNLAQSIESSMAIQLDAEYVYVICGAQFCISWNMLCGTVHSRIYTANVNVLH